MISIVIPFYNEEKRLESGKVLDVSIKKLVSEFKTKLEFILVDDGSTDGTVKLLNIVKKKNNKTLVEIISYIPNKGKGYAVKCGVLKSKGSKIIIMDADFSIDLDETKTFVKQLNKFDVVIGSKKHFLAQTMKKQSQPRRILGKCFTLVTNMMLGLNYTDITCGFKGFKSPVGKKLFGMQSINRWAFDSEILFIAKKLCYTTKELPVVWKHVDGSSISPLKDTWRSFRDLVRILLNNFFGKYDK